jgi:hypothetical protein
MVRAALAGVRGCGGSYGGRRVHRSHLTELSCLRNCFAFSVGGLAWRRLLASDAGTEDDTNVVLANEAAAPGDTGSPRSFA